METRKDIENYLGITDNNNIKYKNDVIQEYLYFKKLYENKQIEMCLIADLGTYIKVDNSNIYEYGKYIAVYKD